MKRIGVIGTGTLGPQLAALFAGCGVRAILFGRQGKARAARNLLGRTKPPALYTQSDKEFIEPADLDRDARRLKDCDWIIECIAEDVEAKRSLYKRIQPFIRDDAVLTSATSGLTRALIAEGIDDRLRPRFFITHFFFPPRYMKLVEVVAGDQVDGDAVSTITSFLEERMGKGIVFAKDTPNFIANRIGVHYVMDAMHLVAERGWPVEAVDTTMGPAAGRPSTAIFRMADMVGIDMVAAVASTIVSHCAHDAHTERCRIPQYLQRMIVNGWTGRKGGQGFYKREGERTMVIDPGRLTYRPTLKFLPPSVAEASAERDAARRLRRVVLANDPGGEIAWTVVSNALVQAADIAGDIADDIESVDRAMRWGYGWELGPFETWDALGVEVVCERLEAERREIPRMVRDMVSQGRSSFYEHPRAGRTTFVGRREAVFANAAGMIRDAADGVGVLALYEGSFGVHAVEIMREMLKRAEFMWRGVIVTNEGDAFPGTLNLYDLLNKARLGRWSDIDGMLVDYQELAQRIRYAKRPIVWAPAGAARGIAAELCLAPPHRCFWVESSLWLDHLLLGLVPAAGGCLNLLKICEDHEHMKRVATMRGVGMCDDGGPHPKVKRAFELIGSAVRSQSAFDAKKAALAAPDDIVVMDRETLLTRCAVALSAIAEDYEPPHPRDLILPGRGGEMALVNDMRTRMGMFPAGTRPRSDVQHDVLICKRLARVLCGGDRPTVHQASDRHVLDLEREAFLSLIGTQESQARIEHFLKSGTYLR